MRVHSALGPGLLESAYEACLVHELHKRGLNAKTQVSLPLAFDGVKLDVGYRIDILVENQVIVELKCIDKILPIHTAQLISYLRLSKRKVGLILNFNVVHMREGIKRIVNKL